MGEKHDFFFLFPSMQLVFIHTLNKTTGICLCLQCCELLPVKSISQLHYFRPWLCLVLLIDYSERGICITVKEMYQKL